MAGKKSSRRFHDRELQDSLDMGLDEIKQLLDNNIKPDVVKEILPVIEQVDFENLIENIAKLNKV